MIFNKFCSYSFCQLGYRCRRAWTRALTLYGIVFTSTMDYSSLPSDPDNPAGTSPWQSSPQHNRTAFTPSEAGTAPSSPVTKHAQSTPEPQHQEHQEEEEAADQDALNGGPSEAYAQSNGASRTPARSDTSTSIDIRFQGPPMTEEELRAKQMQQQRQQERYQQALHAQQHQRGAGPNRYHQGARPGQRQPPQYRLQAKIIALERTGKKDPSIRFDVHVGCGIVPSFSVSAKS